MSTHAGSSSGFSLKSLFPFLRFGNKRKFARRHERFDCVVIGTMKVVEIGAVFEGALVELSRGGCIFRPASLYILDRSGESVRIHTEYFEAEGRIRMVTPKGYGIQLFTELSEETVRQAIAEHGGKLEDSPLAKRN